MIFFSFFLIGVLTTSPLVYCDNLKKINFEGLNPVSNEDRPNVNFVAQKLLKGIETPKPSFLQCGNEAVDFFDGTTFAIKSENYPKKAPLDTDCSFNIRVQKGVGIDLFCYKLHLPCRKENFLDITSSSSGNNTSSLCTEQGAETNVKIPLAANKDIVELTFSHRIDGNRAGNGFHCLIRGSGGAQNLAGPETRADMSSLQSRNVESRSASACGRSRYTRIINGELAMNEEFPWMVHLLLDSSFFCGGSIINSNWILTAAHCSVGIAAENIRAYLGCQTLFCTENIKQISQNVIPLSYTFPQHDLALLEMSAPITAWSNSIRPVCLPNYLLKSGTPLIISGWGTTEQGSLASTLKKAQVSTISDSNCRSWMRPYFPIVCTATGDGNSCQGDSGSAVVFLKTENNEQRYVEYGIVSFGEVSCSLNFPSGNTEVSYYLTFIKSVAGPVETF